jgi:hypothetical protein
MLRIPSPKLIEPGTRALRTVLAGTGALDPAPAGVIEAVSGDVFGQTVVAAELEPIGFDEVSRSIPDPVFRRQLVGAAVALGLTIHPSDPAVATRTRELAAALGVDEPMLGAFERSLEGHRFWMMADFARHSWFGDEVRQEVKANGIRAFADQLARMKGHGADDEEMVAQFAELASFPEESWGRAVSDFYARHHWPLPGQHGSVPMLTTHHDWVHVASGYEASPIGELQVSAFMAAQMPEDTALSILFFAWSIYESGMIKVPLSPGAVGTIGSDPANAHQVADALRRGSESGVDLLDLDHWAHARRPLVEIREEFNIGPKRLSGPDSAPATPTLVNA